MVDSTGMRASIIGAITANSLLGRAETPVTRWASLIGVFVIVPLAVGCWIPPSLWIATMWIVALLTWRQTRTESDRDHESRAGSSGQRHRIRATEVMRIGLWFILAAAILIAMLGWL